MRGRRVEPKQPSSRAEIPVFLEVFDDLRQPEFQFGKWFAERKHRWGVVEKKLGNRLEFGGELRGRRPSGSIRSSQPFTFSRLEKSTIAASPRAQLQRRPVNTTELAKVCRLQMS
jgi:hypothetical protein